MKETLFGIIREERVQLQALIASELQRRDPDRRRLDALRRAVRDIERQLGRYAET